MKYADEGVRAVLVTATLGERGKMGDPAICSVEELPVIRERELRKAVEIIGFSLQAGFGQVQLDVANCTLCLACVSVCPTSALRDDPEKPVLRFDEALCVQCGLCKATCPEKVIELEPRISFAAFGAPPITLKEEEPFRLPSGKAITMRPARTNPP